jgi:hypothetical protein
MRCVATAISYAAGAHRHWSTSCVTSYYCNGRIGCCGRNDQRRDEDRMKKERKKDIDNEHIAQC